MSAASAVARMLLVDLILALKKVKHGSLVAAKQTRLLAYGARDTGYRTISFLRSYEFKPDRYPLDFVTLPVPPRSGGIKEAIPRRIWCVWAGSNEMSPNRRACLDSIRSMNPDLDVQLVTRANISDYIVQQSPLHPSFELLSDVHRADYLHAYLMHHHGGGFTDIKKHPHSWLPAFQEMDGDPDAWITGYQVPRSSESAWIDSRLGRDVRRNYAGLLGFSGKIVRANNPITHEWILEVNRRLDYYTELLKLAPGNIYGDNPGYPLPWTSIGSQIYEPLCLKYRKHIRINPILKPQLWGHR